MGTLIPLTHMGPYVSFLPPIVWSVGSVTDHQPGCCVSKASDFLSSSATSTTSSLSSRRILCPLPAARTIPTVSGSCRKQSAYSAKVSKGLAPVLTVRPGKKLAKVASEKLKVRSLVDEATAHSSDIEGVKASSSSSTSDHDHERNDGAADKGESSGSQLHEGMCAQGEQTEAEKEVNSEDSSEGGSSSDHHEGEGELGEGIEIEETSSPDPIEMDYEDMKVGQERNWSIADMRRVEVLRNFEHKVETEMGDLVVQALRVEHMRAVDELLVDSFAELMGGLLTYRPLLTLTVRQYVRERYACLPDAVTLVGLYSPAEDPGNVDGSRAWLLAATVELSFSNAGHPDIPAGPAPPPGSPYLCNMAVSSGYRRRGIGRQMLRAAEALAESHECEDMYLHCRMVDTAPLNMYRGAGYEVVATDSIFSLLSFQRRRYLMKKKLCPSDTTL